MTSSARRWETAAAAGAYAALTILFTWPLARGLATDVTGDFGDPLLNAWILAWDATHLSAGWREWWNANIFHPHPLALAYSEHLAAQAIQILPIYWLTSNAILCYNVLLLSTYVLSGLGMFLLVRELTANRDAAFLAGLAYAFAPYRAGSLPHLQVLSSAWMPFALFGFRRYLSSRRPAFLVVATAAWLFQNLSCGYYLLFFAPVVGVYLAWEVITRRLWNEPRTLGALAVACGVVFGLTLPFLLPYLELRRLGFEPRTLTETQKFSADVYAFLTADPNLHIWGRLARAWPHAEGALFPGLTVSVLAIVALLRTGTPESGGRLRTVLVIAAGILVLILLLGFSIRLPWLKITSLGRALAVTALAAVAAIALSPGARRSAASWLRTPAGLFGVLTLFAIFMSFGPQIHAKGRVVLDTNLYAVFYDSVPGFDGLRVPARFGMIVALTLSVLAGLGFSELRLAPRRSRAWLLALAAVVAVESFAAPIPTNENGASYVRPGLAPLPTLPSTPPPIYDFVRALPPGSAIVELPLGEPAFDVRYVYFSTHHWKPLVNGYSGGRPADYELLDQLFQDLFARPERAWDALRNAHPTHAVVHESYYAEGRGSLVSAWLRSNGAREIGAAGADRLFALP